jgi:hypothetical protein
MRVDCIDGMLITGCWTAATWADDKADCRNGGRGPQDQRLLGADHG